LGTSTRAAAVDMIVSPVSQSGNDRFSEQCQRQALLSIYKSVQGVLNI
jgi:hypothetical protein